VSGQEFHSCVAKMLSLRLRISDQSTKDEMLKQVETAISNLNIKDEYDIVDFDGPRLWESALSDDDVKGLKHTTNHFRAPRLKAAICKIVRTLQYAQSEGIICFLGTSATV
jgi:hypothetical protein